jgi:hypothetical protein
MAHLFVAKESQNRVPGTFFEACTFVEAFPEDISYCKMYVKYAIYFSDK